MFEFLRKYILQLFVSVIVEDDKVIIRTNTFRKNKTISVYEKTFDDKEKAFLYIKDLSKNFEIYYIGVLLSFKEQGLVPTLNELDIDNFNLDHTSLKTINLKNSQVYVNSDEFKSAIDFFDKYSGVDFAYSPISILYYCIQKQFKNNSKTTCYVYKDEFCISVLVCKDDDILFGDFFKIDKVNSSDISYEKKTKDIETSDNLEKENSDEIDENEKQEENLDNIDDENHTEELNLLEDEKNNLNLNNFSDDMDMCRYIFSKIDEFYNNSNYNSSFIEELVIFSNTHCKEDFIVDHIENEIFLKPQIIQIDTLDLIIELMHKELDNGL